MSGIGWKWTVGGCSDLRWLRARTLQAHQEFGSGVAGDVYRCLWPRFGGGLDSSVR